MSATETVAPARARWWRAWRARFGLAELCGTVAALASFTAGYLAAGSLLTAAGLATICETTGFYGCIAAKTAVAARQDTAHLAGCRRLAAGTWHAVTEQLASCAAAEALDGFLVRPGCLAGAAWLAQPLPGGVWLGFAVGKIVADLAWYGMEAWARCGVARTRTTRAARHTRRISSRTGCRRSSSASTYDVTSTPLTTKLLTSPSITASCITTPISRARLKSHSRNSAPVRSWSSNLAMPASIHRRTDTPHAMRSG